MIEKAEIYTVELNLDDDFTNPCAWHVDTYMRTATKNIEAAQEKRPIAKWVLVGIENSLHDAVEYASKLRESMFRQKNQKD